MVERKLRPAPSTLHLLPSRKPARTGNAAAAKLFVLDTNVLIHNPDSVLNFEEHRVIIPMTVLEELDKLKTGKHSVAAECRQAIRLIEDLGERMRSNPDSVRSQLGDSVCSNTGYRQLLARGAQLVIGNDARTSRCSEDLGPALTDHHQPTGVVGCPVRIARNSRRVDVGLDILAEHPGPAQLQAEVDDAP